VHREFRKPLIVMTPKSLLRHRECVSSIEMFAEGSSFHRVLYEDVELAPPEDIKRVVLCSGKVYYDLKKERDERGIQDVTMVRLEQLYPFPAKALEEELVKYPNADVVWCQEEPENMGAWYFVDRRIEGLLEMIGHKTKRPIYAGRPDAAAPATGLLRRHLKEQAALIDAALTIN
jgi:2-oxoglutarate dehydrogenase E1 component